MTYAFDGERAARGEAPRRGAQGGESAIEVHEPTVVVENMRRSGALIELRCAAMAEAGTPGDWQQASDEAQRALVELRRVGRQLALSARAAGAEGETPARAEASRTAAEILATAEQRMAEAPESPARAAAVFARTDEVVACFARTGESSARAGFEQVERQFRALLPTLSAPELRQLRAATRDADHAVARAFATVTPERRDRMTEALFAPKLAFAAEVRDAGGAQPSTRGAAGGDRLDVGAAPAAVSAAPIGAQTEIDAMATEVERAIAMSAVPFGPDQPQNGVARALLALEAAIERAPGPLRPPDQEAIERALRAADSYARRAGAGPARALHRPLLKVQATAKRHGFAIDVVTEAVLANGAAALGIEDLRELVGRSERQLERGIEQLREWELASDADALFETLRVLRLSTVHLYRDTDVDRPDLVLQARTLFEAAGEIDAHVQLAASAGAVAGTPERRIFAKVVSAYARAMARSRVDPDPLAAARLEKQRLPLNLTRASLAEGRRGLETLEALDPAQGRAAGRAYDRADQKVHDLDGRMHAGRSVGAADLADVAITARELAFRHRVLTMEAQLEALAQAASKADEGWVAFFANAYAIEFKALPGKLREQRARMALYRTNHNQNVADATAAIDEADPERRAIEVVLARQASLEFIETRLADYLATQRLQQLLEGALAAINDAGTRAIVTELIAHTALAIAISAGAGVAAAAVGRVAATGTALALDGVVAATSASRIANVAGVVAQVTTDAMLNTVGQKLVLGDQASWTAAFTANAAVSAALAPLSGLFARWGSGIDVSEVRTATIWAARGKRVVLAGGAMSYEMVAAAAIEYVTKRALHEKPPALDEQTATAWLLQGAAMAVGRAITGRLSGLQERYAAVADQAVYTPAQLDRVRALAKIAETRGTVDAAQDATAEYHRLIEAEHDAIAATLVHGPGDARLRTAMAGNDAARAETSSAAFEQLPLRLAGLEPENAAGMVWRGTHEEIRSALDAAGRGGHPVEVVARGDSTTAWRVRLGDRELEFIEAPAAKRRAPKHARDDDGAVGRDQDAVTQTPRDAEDSAGHDDGDVATTRVTTASMVPGSEFRGARGARDPEAVLAASDGAFASAMRAVGAVQRIEPGVAPHTFVVTVPPGRSFSVRVMTAPLEQAAVARTLINTTKRGVTTVERSGSDGAAATRLDVMVEGRFVIQLSDGLDPAHVERALVHESREILAERDLADGEVGARADALVEGPLRPGAVLSPHDLGRVAELNYLSASARDPARAESAQREVLALIDHLGLREGAVGADERRLLVHDHLSEPARRALDGLRAETDALPAEAASQLAQVRDVAAKDATARAADAAYRAPLHETPVAATAGSKVSASERSALAAQAAAARAERSRTTVAAFRAEAAALPAGRYPTVDSPLVGAGAALAGRRTDQLVVDDRGRWQADAAARIAQTAQQLGPLVDAGLGDPFQFASPTERVPMEAVRYWEDSIAAQGPVIDGRGTLKFADDGKVLLEVMPSEGPPPITLEVTGIPVQASGFPRERVPGMTFGKSPTQALTDLDQALSGLAGDADHPLQAQATEARGRLRAISGAAKDDAGLAAQIFGEYPELRAALAGNATVGPATKTLEAYGAWDAMRSKDLADGSQRVFMGDEANLATFDPQSADSWVIAGTGGTGISAAEIILEKNPKAHVTMVGMDQPAGLMENDQARRLVTKHGDATTVPEGTAPGDGRFHLKSGVRVNAPKELMVDGQRQYEVWSDAATGESIHGEGYIAAIGREGELPPAIHELAWRANQQKPKSVSAEPLFDADRQYLGYKLIVEHSSGALRVFDITGAASRYAPPAWVENFAEVGKEIALAREVDAPPESGNFDGGFVASATQAARRARFRRAEAEGKER